MRVAIVHYAYIPVIGGVEFIMAQHAALFTRHGHEVRVVCGSGVSRSEDVACIEIPALLPNAPQVLESQKEALSGLGGESPAFHRLKHAIKSSLHQALEGCDVIFVHNMMTMHFNLAATTALCGTRRRAPGTSAGSTGSTTSPPSIPTSRRRRSPYPFSSSPKRCPASRLSRSPRSASASSAS